MKSSGGFLAPIPPSTKMPHGKVMSHKLASGFFVEMSIRSGKKRLSHSSGYMVLLAVEKLFYCKFLVSTTAYIDNIKLKKILAQQLFRTWLSTAMPTAPLTKMISRLVP